MGRELGSFADDRELDRPDLNKCPDCDCFFATDNCPLCGKECPPHMRAGNRIPQKPRKSPRRGNGRVSFVAWYHSLWFIALMMLIFPLVGIILILTSPYKTRTKVIANVIAAIYMVISYFGIGSIISNVSDLIEKPVTTSLSKEDYIARCEDVTPEQFYRAGDTYKGQFVSMTLRVVGKATITNTSAFFYNEVDDPCYVCEAEDGSEYKIVLRDCFLEDQQRLIPGDVVTVYGEGAGEREAYDEDYDYAILPCLNVAYLVRK